MEMVHSSASAVQAVHADIFTLRLGLPAYHHHLAKKTQPSLLDLALSAVAPASVVLRLIVFPILYKRAVTLNHLEIMASEECSYVLWEIFCIDKCDLSVLETVGTLSCS